MKQVLIIAFLVATSSYAFADEFAVVQCLLPTANGGTVDCTSSGFGTPKGAIVFGGYGVANGTSVANAGFFIGAYDGTRQLSLGGGALDNQATTDSGSFIDTNSGFSTFTPDTKDADCTISFITDGIRIACSDAPPIGYRVNVFMTGGSGVTSVYVGQSTGNASQDGTTTVSAPGFEPDAVIFACHNANTAHFRPSLGFAWNNSGSIVQRGLGYDNTNNAATSSTSSILATNRILQAGVASVPSIELTAFNANGFVLTTRDAAGARDCMYHAIKMANGLRVWLGTKASPTSTGSQAVTGVGFTPQAGLMLYGEFAAVDTLYTADNGELFGLSAFTASSSATSSVYGEDGAADSIEASITDSKMCRSLKDGADFITCTLTSFDADGLTRNYTTTSGTARQQAVLLFESSTPVVNFITRRRFQ